MMLCLASLPILAQQKNAEKEKEAAQKAMEQCTITLATLIQNKSSDYVISQESTSKNSGVRHIYLRQAINGLEVFGTESSVHFDVTGSVLMEHNKFLNDVQATVKNSSQVIDARAAIVSVANQMGYKISNLNEVKNIGGINKAAVYNKAGISLVNIPIKLMYYYREGLGTQLIWELSIAETTSSDWWNFRVDASNGKIIDKNNWTVSCNIMDGHNEHFHSAEAVNISPAVGPLNKNEIVNNKRETTQTSVFELSPAMVGGYRVYAMPVESPNHGARTLQNNPDNPTASPFGWHDTNGVAGPEFTVTTGNNVDAHKGSARPDGTASLIFDFPIDLNQNPASNTAPYITNLFYWNNIIHDVLYQYGFDEAGGNFQENNYGNGGLGSDSVNANAQASGDCNANFGTPSDGQNPTMNMFLCSNSNPPHDGDLDAGVITHEYCHGVSNRLTGGALNTNCLNNTEQMGEGWSDFYGLLLTIEPGDTGTDARGVGTYLLGQPITGNGVRTKRYSTDFAVNDHTYDDIKSAVVPHGIGEIWATMLWDVTWEIIATDGFNPDVYNGTGGNNVALAIVTEGLKLQPCSPGFVDGRDAILAADQALYGGAHVCAIWEAFARRGLGFSASQGSSSSKTDGTEAFDLPPNFSSLNVIDEVCLSDGIQTGLSGGSPAGGTYSGPGVTDNGNGTTYTFDPAVGGPGLVTVTYMVNDFCTGAPTTLTDDINVTNNPPEIICVGSGLIPMNGSQTSTAGVAIPDGNSTGVTVTMNVTEDVSITDLNVNVNITHSWVGDISVSIKSPSGTTALIIDRPGRISSGFGCSGNNIVATLDDEAANPVEDECESSEPTINGSFSPNNPLSVFDGESTVGVWELKVIDNAGGDSGTLNTWGIEYGYEVTAAVLDVTLDGNGVATVNAEDLLYDIAVECGGYTVLAGSPLTATVTFTCADIGINNVPVQATNDSGAAANCVAMVNVISSGGGGALSCPGNISQGNDTGICGAVVDYTVVSPVGCSGGTLTQTSGLASGSTFPVGTTTNTFEYDDGVNPVQSCSFDITINDTELPILSCPLDQTVIVPTGGLYTLPDYFANGEATVTDNCTDPVTNTTQNPAPGTQLSDGVHTITFTAQDLSGNTATCTFELTVTILVGVDSFDYNSLSLLPNPAKDKVVLVNSQNLQLEKLSIYDIRGRLITTINLENMTSQEDIDVSQLESATYFIMIQGKEGQITKRLIKE
ncbi:regulatory P domain of subtilisin-like proprotein convertases [Aequorivita sublithincola DSM 14238]|uniref:Regulatory P domain of subtilisin-like proprotein convertases n=2 Tax=Aequorivita TaxID=153265 RepID=I3YRG7_AEQSU|nr:regulatory P domain of subtilisin-like proprotein convertases [Aequorivita sublithincola DSM 14238]